MVKRVSDMKSLAAALQCAQEGTFEVRDILVSASFRPQLPGLTKMVSKLSKEGAFRKGLEVYFALTDLNILPDTAITNAAISACDRGGQWQSALEILAAMDRLGLKRDAITYSSVISALAKGKQWTMALDVFAEMQQRGVEADVVTCCALMSALERGGQWQMAERIFLHMCTAPSRVNSSLRPRFASLLCKEMTPERHPRSPSPLSALPRLPYASSAHGFSFTPSLSDHSPSATGGGSFRGPGMSAYGAYGMSAYGATRHPAITSPSSDRSETQSPYLFGNGTTPPPTPGSGAVGEYGMSGSMPPNVDSGSGLDISFGELTVDNTSTGWNTHVGPPLNGESPTSADPVVSTWSPCGPTTPPIMTPFAAASYVTPKRTPGRLTPFGGPGNPVSSPQADTESSPETPTRMSHLFGSEPFTSYFSTKPPAVCSIALGQTPMTPEKQPCLPHSEWSSPTEPRPLATIEKHLMYNEKTTTTGSDYAGVTSDYAGVTTPPNIHPLPLLTGRRPQAAPDLPACLSVQLPDSPTEGGTPQQHKCGNSSVTLSPEGSSPSKPWGHDSPIRAISQTLGGRPPTGLYGGSRSSVQSPRQAMSPYRPPPPPPGPPGGPLRSPIWRSPFGVGSLAAGGFPSPASRAPSPCHTILEGGPEGLGRAVSLMSELGSEPDEAADGALPADVLDQRLPQLTNLRFSAVSPNRVCCNALLAAYARAKPPQWEKAMRLLGAMEETGGEVTPDTVSYNTVLKVCGKVQRIDHALHVYRQMVSRGVQPSLTTFATLITAACDSNSYGATKQAWIWLHEWGLEVNSACLNSYMAALVKLGHWDEVRGTLRVALAPALCCKP